MTDQENLPTGTQLFIGGGEIFAGEKAYLIPGSYRPILVDPQDPYQSVAFAQTRFPAGVFNNFNVSMIIGDSDVGGAFGISVHGDKIISPPPVGDGTGFMVQAGKTVSNILKVVPTTVEDGCLIYIKTQFRFSKKGYARFNYSIEFTPR